MYRHVYFDLYLHQEDELGAMLDSPISQRQVVQEWPLSCVQCIITSDGRKLIYKAQHDPTVEPEFFANAKSELLVTAQTVFRSGAYSAMLIEYIEGPTLSKMNPLPESLAVEIGGEILRRISQIEGQLPYYLDVSAQEEWYDWMYKVLSALRGLVVTGAFQLVQAEELFRLERLAFSNEVLATFHTRIGYVRHDLAGDNVFV